MFRARTTDRAFQKICKQTGKDDSREQIGADPAHIERLGPCLCAFQEFVASSAVKEEQDAGEDQPGGIAEIGQHFPKALNGFRQVTGTNRCIEDQHGKDDGIQGNEKACAPAQWWHDASIPAPAPVQGD